MKLPYVFVVALGVPLLVWARKRHPEWSIFRSPVRFGFLTDGYHRNSFYWEGFILGRRIVIGILATLLAESALRAKLLLFFNLIVLIATFVAQPFVSRTE